MIPRHCIAPKCSARAARGHVICYAHKQMAGWRIAAELQRCHREVDAAWSGYLKACQARNKIVTEFKERFFTTEGRYKHVDSHAKSE